MNPTGSAANIKFFQDREKERGRENANSPNGGISLREAVLASIDSKVRVKYEPRTR